MSKVAVLAMAACAVSVPASAQVLDTWSLSVWGSLTSTSEVEGRTQVGGSLGGGSSTYGTMLTNSMLAANPTSVRIGGATSVGNLNLNRGDFRHTGPITGNINNNGGGVVVTDPAVAGQVMADRATMLSASSFLAGLAAQSTVSIPGSPSAVNIVATTSGPDNIAVINVPGALFSSGNVQQISLTIVGGGSVIFNVTGTSITFSQGNFVGSINTDAYRERVLWNFPSATSVDLQRQWNGALLAPLAHLSNNTVIAGSVAVASMTQNGEVHLPVYTGYIPAPGAGAALGLCGLVALRRRR